MPQLHRAVSLLLTAGWPDGRPTARQLQRLIETLEYHQSRNAQARASHTKSTLAALDRQGIVLDNTIRCGPDG